MCPHSLTRCNMCHLHSLRHAPYLCVGSLFPPLSLSSWQHVIEMAEHMKTWQMAGGICASSSRLPSLARSLQLELSWQLVIELLRHTANGRRDLCFIIIITTDAKPCLLPHWTYLRAWLQHRMSQHVLMYELWFFGSRVWHFPTESRRETGYAD